MFRTPVFLIALAVCCATSPVGAARYDGKLTLRVVDKLTGQPIAARMELRNGRGRPMRVRPKGAIAVGDYFVFDGQVTLELRKGPYTFLIEAGPEYQTRPGHFSIERHAEDKTQVVLERRVNMQAEGWWAGDLDVRHRPQDLPLLMRAAHVNLVPLFVRENVQGKCHQAKHSAKIFEKKLGDLFLGPKFALDHRRGGGLLVFDETASGASLNVCRLKSDAPSLAFSLPNDDTNEDINDDTDTDTTLIALTPFAWDLPVWVAAGKLDALQIIHRHALADNVVDNEGWGRKRDKTFFPGKTGNGRWSETIYHHLLNCGLRIPPAAGSGSGTNKNPVGTNRVYVQCGEECSRKIWFEGLRAGKVMVTNGPLLRTEVSGQAPGHQFQLDAGESRDFQIALGLAFYEKAPVEYLEIVKNGRVVHEIRLSELAEKQGRLPALNFDSSGWFLVRAMTSSTKNYQYATTGPYYVESNYQPRISRKSVQFFLNWLDEAGEEFADNEAVLAEINSARPFWGNLLGKANAD